MVIREIELEDAEQFLRLNHELDQETQFMMLEPGERKTTIESQQKQIERIQASYNKTIFVAENEDKLVGYIAAVGGSYKRNRHCASLVVGVLQAYSGQGVGSQLFQALYDWAPRHRIHRLELTVLVSNHAASVLYHRMGFEIEGFRQKSLRIEGKFVDEYFMAKLL